MKTHKITIHTDISADAETVWNYYTAPEHITKWNYASPDWHCPKAENDLRVGGKFSSRMEAKDGSFGFDFEGMYDEVNPPGNLIYSMNDNRKVSVHFEAAGDKTRVTITFDSENENPEEMQREGWQAILNNFKKYVESR